MKKWLPALVGVSLWAHLGAAQEKGTPIKFTEYDMPNGLHVILHKDNSAPVVAVTVMYHVGARLEQENRRGFAHFFEHLLFEGSDNLKRGEYMRTIKNAGGQLNANTTSDRTFYYEILPSNQLELALYMESERMLHAKIDKIGVETQREVVKEEKRQRYDNRPYGKVGLSAFDKSFKVHPYKVSTIGRQEDLNAASLEEFIAFYNKFYVPNNAILSIAGDIDIAKTKALIDRYFSEIKRGTEVINRTVPQEPEQTAERRDTVYDNTNLPAFISAYHVPAQGSQEAYAIRMLSMYLSDGNSAVLNKELVDKSQLALSINAFGGSSEDPGLLIAFGIANQGVEIAKLKDATDAIIQKLSDTPLTEREFQKVYNKVEANFVTQNGTAAGIAERLAQYKMYYGDANLINTEIERYKKLTPAFLQTVAKKYLTPQNRTLIYYLPKKSS